MSSSPTFDDCAETDCPCITVISETPSTRLRRATVGEDIATMLARHGCVAVIRFGHRGGWQDALVEASESTRDFQIPWDGSRLAHRVAG